MISYTQLVFRIRFRKETQLDMLPFDPRFENVEMLRPGYAVEYDYVELRRTLEVQKVKRVIPCGTN